MVGTWLSGADLGPAPDSFGPDFGWIVELGVRDERGNDQGTILVGALQLATTEASGWVFEGMCLLASDEYYRWWLEKGEGSPHRGKGWYHLCGVEECKGV